MKKTLLVLAIVVFQSVNLAFSQDTDTDALLDMSLEELMNLEVYTTSRTQSQESKTAPATVRVITEEQIQLRGYQSLLDIFYDMPEVKVDFGVDPRWMNDITMRGIRGMDKFVILLDGVRISSPTNDVIAVMENYPVHMAEQVEVVFGPASALYGADAFAGVINIVTKKSKNESETNIMVSGGMYNTVTSNMYIHKKLNKKASFSIAGQYFIDKQPDLAEYYLDEYEGMDKELETGTFNTIFGPVTPEAPVKPHKSHPLNAYGIYAGFAYDEFSISYFGNHSRNPSTMANSPHNSVYNREQMFGHYINMGNIKYEKDFSAFKSTSVITFSRYDLDSRSNFRNIWTNMEPAYLFAYGQMGKAEQLFTYFLNDQITITAGGTFEQFESMPRSNNLQYPVYGDDPEGAIVNSPDSLNPGGIPADLIKTEYNNAGGLLQIEYKPTSFLSLTIGGRVDNDDRFGTTINPRIGLVAEPVDRLTIKGLYGSAFLAPSPQNMYDRYGTFNTDDGGLSYYSVFFQMPNPDLEPQKVNTSELGLSYLLSKNLNINVTGYFSQVTGLISPVTDSIKIAELYPNMTYQGYPVFGMQINDNLGESNIYGGTLGLNYIHRFSKESKLNIYGSYSYIDGTTDIDEDGPVKERNLPGVSNHTIKAGVDFTFRNLSVSPRITTMSKQRTFNAASVKESDETQYQEIDGFILGNVNVNYKLGDNFTIFVNVENFTDARYRNVNIGAAPESVGAGSAAVEFAEGAPQNPIRATGGFRLHF